MFQNIVVLTGAGISAESGIATFRDNGGLWNNYRVEDVAAPEGFRRNPQLVHDFYNMRRRDLENAEPNAAHYALARLEAEFGADVTIVTQNVDDLHERAGTKNLIHMHGELLSVRCTACTYQVHTHEDTSVDSVCPQCGRMGTLRPDIVWFGEVPIHMDRIERLLYKADLFISLGTSGAVYPAAGFVQAANSAGAHTVELNLEKSHGASYFKEKIYGKAGEVVPEYVERLIHGGE